ncbi:MAG: DNA repair protein RecO [Gammaproteobacteria bacterium]
MQKYTRELAYVLYSKPCAERGLFLEVLTQQGRLGLFLKNHVQKKSKIHALQAFMPVYIDAAGQGDLQTITQIEWAQDRAFELKLISPLQGKALISALYINELLCYFLKREEALPEIFDSYEKVLHALNQSKNSEKIDLILRIFECQLLDVLGFNFLEYPEFQKLEPEAWYKIDLNRHCYIKLPLLGNGPGNVPDNLLGQGAIQGKVFWALKNTFALALEQLDYLENSPLLQPEIRKQAKFLLRMIVQFYLGNRVIKTRAYYSA